MARPRKPLQSGQRFGMWSVVADQWPVKRILCRCVCGVERLLYRSNLTGGMTRSCGAAACKQKAFDEKAPAAAGSVRRFTSGAAAIRAWREQRGLGAP